MMKKIASISILVLIISMFFSCAKDEEDLSGTIGGIVTEYASANTPIAGATVTINGKGLSKTTGSDGRYEFEGLEPGTYTISVNANNYQATTKQVTVYAGQKVNCDIQLEQEQIKVDISPTNLVFDKSIDQLSFSISNQSNQELAYSITCFMQDVEVTPKLGSIKAKAQQAVSVRINNRSNFKTATSGQIHVSIGKDSYMVNVTVNGTEENATTGSVMGLISDHSTNTPIGGATVSMASTGHSKTTGSDGRYEFTDLPPGTYTITVSANEYQGETKDITIEAGKIANCDFQLQKGAANIEITPQSLVYASDIDQLSFTIRNGSSSTQQYTVSNVPDFASVSSSTGMIPAKGSEAIMVNIPNRKQIKEKKSGLMTVNVGNNAYVVSLTIEPYQEEPVNIEISTQTLSFDKDTEQLTFTIVSKTNRALDYSITNDLAILTVSPTKGTLKERGQSTITVNVQDRKKIDADRVGKLTINIEDNTYVVTVNVAKYEVDASVSPQNLTFNNDTEQQSLTITNNNAQQLDYTISSDLGDVLSISPTNGNISAKERKDIVVSIKDRKNISADKSGQLTITIGGKTFTVNVAITKAETNANVSPQSLSFDKNTDQLSFTISNSNIWANDYKVTNNLDILTVSPASGTIKAKEQQSITVKVNNRQSVTAEQSGKLTVNIGTLTFNIDVSVAKYEQGTQPSTEKTDVTRGLQAYYTFDDGTANDSRNGYNGIFNGGTLISDTPSGSGQALFLKKDESVSIPYAPLDGKKNHTISVWIKDFGAGYIFNCNNTYVFGPSLQITEGMQLKHYTGVSWSSDNYKTFTTSLSSYQSEQWTMVTVVTSTEGNNSQGTIRMYINGQRVNSRASYTNNNSGAIAMTIGGSFGDISTDPQKIDNVRLYSVALTDEEVANIYNFEK